MQQVVGGALTLFRSSEVVELPSTTSSAANRRYEGDRLVIDAPPPVAAAGSPLFDKQEIDSLAANISLLSP
ncbi:unnamed protein product, partial [Amoebophrya sp. A25]|eukprot:GSA25T00010085001.1